MATTIREILDTLNDQDRRTLIFAFEEGVSQHIRLKDGHYLGVNLDHQKLGFHPPSMEAGKWSYGTCPKSK